MANIVLRVDVYERLGLIDRKLVGHWYKLSKMTQLPPAKSSICIAFGFHMDVIEVEWREYMEAYDLVMHSTVSTEHLENVKKELEANGFSRNYPHMEIHDRRLDAISSQQVAELIQAVKTLSRATESANRCF